MKRWEKYFVIGFIILNSISGLQIAGVSINAIFVSVFFLFSCVEYLKHRRNETLKLPKKSGFLMFTICSFVSCLMSMAYVFRLEHYSIVESYLFNSILYFIIFVLFFNCTGDFISEISDCFACGLVYAARIQAIWGVAQMILMYAAGININQILFVDVLHSTNVNDWVMGFFTGNAWNMRITGLNYENSMFALVVCLGAALEQKKIWKAILLIVAVLSLSRTGWVMVAGYLGIATIKSFKRIAKFNRKKIIKKCFGWIGGLILSLYTYINVPSVNRQVSNILLRITDSGSVHISGMRHLLYYPYGFEIWLMRSNILQMLFGYGMRCSGVAFSEQQDICNIIGIQQYSGAWAVECDIIGLLLGGGICTLLAYYYELSNCLKTKFGGAIIMLLLGGITYHYHSISYVIFLVMMASLCRMKAYKERANN